MCPGSCSGSWTRGLEDIDKIFGEIREALMDLMTDPFGNYLVQKLLEVCSRQQQMEVLAMVTARDGDPREYLLSTCTGKSLVP